MESLAATGTDGRQISLGPQRAKSADFSGQTRTEFDEAGAKKNLGKHAVCRTFPEVFASEDDGTRTRNHRIDSPVSLCQKDTTGKPVTTEMPVALAHSLAHEIEASADLARI